MKLQKTLKQEVSIQGIGLHSGRPTRLTLKPAPVNHGIWFVRSDCAGALPIQAHYSQVVNTRLATVLERHGSQVGSQLSWVVSVSTVEHVLAALYAVGIDNLILEVNGPEIPIMDGSGFCFYEALLSAGIEVQSHCKRYLRLARKIEFKLGEKWAVLEPAPCLELFVSVEWDHPAIGYQEFSYREGVTPVLDWIQARTFGFAAEVEALRKIGLAVGASLENAVGLDAVSVLNAEGLRYPDEFVKHKVLDALGDFMLAGLPIQGRFRLHRSGHDLHFQLLKHIFEDSRNYEIIETHVSAQSECQPVLHYAAG